MLYNYNIYPEPMRDTSRDLTTGWIRDGMYLSRPEGFLAGLGELGETVSSLPNVGQMYVKDALADPQARARVVQLLKCPNPQAALAKQAEDDVMEAVHPTGKPVIFKAFAAKVAPRVRAAEDAMMEALPNKDTPEAEDAVEISRVAENPQEAMNAYYTQIALDAMAPEEDIFGEEEAELMGWGDEDEATAELEPYGLGITKKAKKILKGVAIGVAVVAGTVLTAGVILPALGTAAAAVGGVVSSAASAVFGRRGQAGGGGAVEQAAAPPPGITQEEFNAQTRAIYEAQKTNPTQAAQMRQALVNKVTATGQYDAADANELIDQTLAAYAQSEGATAGAPAAPTDLETVANAGVDIYRAYRGGATQDQINQLRQMEIERLSQQGVPPQQASTMVQYAMDSAARQDAAGGYSMPPVSYEEAESSISRAGMGIGISPGTIALLGVGFLAVMMMGRRRRNPGRVRYNPRGRRRNRRRGVAC